MKTKHSLLRLASIAYDTPHLITTHSLDKMLSYLDLRNEGLVPMFIKDNDDDSTSSEEKSKLDKGLGYVKVDGAITYKPVTGACGEVKGTSYVGLLNSVEELVEEGVKTIVVDFSTPGGQASHAFEHASEIRALADTNGVELVGYVDEMACSAGYLLACICDEVIANPDAITGSIGAVVALTDVSKAMDNAGVKRVFITSGSSKVPFAEDGSFKQEFLTKIQKDVDMLNDKFAEHVSKYTGLAVEDIKALNAETFNADEALEIGLINSIMTNSEFAAYISAKHKAKTKGAINA